MPKRLFSAVCGMWWLSFSSSHIAASHRPRTQPPRHHTRAHSWCTPWLAVSCGRLRSSPWLHTFTAAHARCSDLFRSGPTCGTKVDDCIRATAPAYLLLELLSLVCGLGRQEQLGRSRVHHVHAGGKQCFEGQRRWGHSIEASSSSTHSCFARLSAYSQSWRCS